MLVFALFAQSHTPDPAHPFVWVSAPALFHICTSMMNTESSMHHSVANLASVLQLLLG